ncbi:hypothetical protein DUNSADRAFT_10790 [Dunaliella salina]|uniref:Mce/MlaD domain-containing protein n=1 Tax=Dunaliella salina TaxID=3046 RepID=A0ABQ7H9W1_DUNSA|nr:hypothetical protein DUNSADRAFT_10790 [Dunaliella salina]|eukprot:KAF5843615.1 hypothetical protein DUNSADRAFT_10790 [Dunaliella salina]
MLPLKSPLHGHCPQQGPPARTLLPKSMSMQSHIHQGRSRRISSHTLILSSQRTGAQGGDADSPSARNPQGHGNWLHQLLAQPMIAKLVQQIPQIVKAAQEQVLLFVCFGVAAAVTLIGWAKGSSMHRDKPYVFNVKFPEAEGIEAGVPLRLKGVRVGEVQDVAVDMHTGVTAQVEVFLGQTLIPKHPNVKIEYNRTGMMSPEPFIDVSVPSRASPYAMRTPSRKAAQPQEGQQSERHVDTADAAAAVAASPSRSVDSAAGEDALSSNEAQHGSETGTEDASVSEEDQRQLPQRSQGVQGGAQVKQATSTPDKQAGARASLPTPSPDITQGEFIQPGDVVEGSIGGSTDILTRMTVKHNRGPPGSGKIQLQR